MENLIQTYSNPSMKSHEISICWCLNLPWPRRIQAPPVASARHRRPFASRQDPKATAAKPNATGLKAPAESGCLEMGQTSNYIMATVY